MDDIGVMIDIGAAEVKPSVFWMASAFQRGGKPAVAHSVSILDVIGVPMGRAVTLTVASKFWMTSAFQKGGRRN